MCVPHMVASRSPACAVQVEYSNHVASLGAALGRAHADAKPAERECEHQYQLDKDMLVINMLSRMGARINVHVTTPQRVSTFGT